MTRRIVLPVAGVARWPQAVVFSVSRVNANKSEVISEEVLSGTECSIETSEAVKTDCCSVASGTSDFVVSLWPFLYILPLPRINQSGEISGNTDNNLTIKSRLGLLRPDKI